MFRSTKLRDKRIAAMRLTKGVEMIVFLFTNRNTGISFQYSVPLDWQMASIEQYCRVFNTTAEILEVVK